MYIVNALEPSLSTGTKSKFHFHVLAYTTLVLRNCVSLFSRLSISDEEVHRLSLLCKEYYKLNVQFFSCNPTVWTLGHVVPVHTKEMKCNYGFGLALNSMEGRECKHTSISRYSTNTTVQNRWQQIFMHEYITLIWLREQGYNRTTPKTSSGSTYIPKRATNNDNYCGCGLNKSSNLQLCQYCSHPYRQKIKAKVA